MPQHHDLSRSLLTLDQTSTLIAVIEMSQANWLVAAIVSGIDRHPLKKIAADEADLLRFLRRWQAEAAKAGQAITRIAVASRSRSRRLSAARWLRRATSRTMSPTQPASPFRASTGGPKRIGSYRVAQACFSGAATRQPDHCTWRPSRPLTKKTPSARAASDRIWLGEPNPARQPDEGGFLARPRHRSFRPTLRNASRAPGYPRRPRAPPAPPNTLAETVRCDLARLRFVRNRSGKLNRRSGQLAKAPGERRNTMVCLLARVVEVASRLQICSSTRPSPVRCGTAGPAATPRLTGAR